MDEGRGNARRERLHRRAWDLLPWYVNGTLAAGERRVVEEHLATCAACRDEAARCRETEAAVRAAGEVAPSPHPARLARLMERIDQAEADEAAAGAPLGRRLGRPLAASRRALSATPRAVRLLVAAQAAALLVTVGALAWRAPAVFQTLSQESPAEAGEGAAAAGTRVRVLFADGTTEREMRELLAAVRGRIVGGPSPLGAWVVEVPTGESGDPLEVVLAHLRSRRQVTFAEPVAGGAGPEER